MSDADDQNAQNPTAAPDQAAQPAAPSANYGGISAEDFEAVDDFEDLPF